MCTVIYYSVCVIIFSVSLVSLIITFFMYYMFTLNRGINVLLSFLSIFMILFDSMSPLEPFAFFQYTIYIFPINKCRNFAYIRLKKHTKNCTCILYMYIVQCSLFQRVRLVISWNKLVIMYIARQPHQLGVVSLIISGYGKRHMYIHVYIVFVARATNLLIFDPVLRDLGFSYR
jgi:hypothetical protein